MSGIYRLRANEYVHMEDGNSGEVYTLLGPLTFTMYDHLRPLQPAPQPCVVVPPGYYVKIKNPVHRFKEYPQGRTSDSYGYQLIHAGPSSGDYREALAPSMNSSIDPMKSSFITSRPAFAYCRLGEFEYRLTSSDAPHIPSSPFPLFPGEIAEPPEPLPVLCDNEALLLKANHPTQASFDPSGYRIFRGPGTYYPQPFETIAAHLSPLVVGLNESLHLQAVNTFIEEEVDAKTGEVHRVTRVAGEEWTRTTQGLYFLHPHAKLVASWKPVVLSPHTAALMEARYAFADERVTHYRTDAEPLPRNRLPGEQWLLTFDRIPVFTPTHNEFLVKMTPLTIIGAREYCKIKNPYDPVTKTPQWGSVKLIQSPCSFFLMPGEELVDDQVWSAYDFSEDEALLVEAVTTHRETVEGSEEAILREALSRWLIYGPGSYIPPLEVKVLEWRKKIPLTSRQGVYVQNVLTGVVRSVFGAPFILSADEVLWEKPVSELVRRLLPLHSITLRGVGPLPVEDTFSHPVSPLVRATSRKKYEGSLAPESVDLKRYGVVTAEVPQNHLVRLHNTRHGTSRVVSGPCMVSLSPDEEFCIVKLSGGRPKAPDQIFSLRLFLGPDYMADKILVETLDHTRLWLLLAYNWEFEWNMSEKEREKAFAVTDFVGEACRALASRVRAVIAGVTFENFHLHFTSILRRAIFCSSADGCLQLTEEGTLYFPVNGLRITTVDVQLVEPEDTQTLFALQKSVQLAVEIITTAQENEATQQAALLEQEAAGALELQVMKDRCHAESDQLQLLEVEGHNAEIELIGASVAHAMSQRESRLVEAEARLEAAPTRSLSVETTCLAEREVLENRVGRQLDHQRALKELSIAKKCALAEIEASKYERIMESLGQETVVALAEAGPKLQAELLQALGLQGFIISDGRSPVNLFDVAGKLITASDPKVGV